MRYLKPQRTRLENVNLSIVFYSNKSSVSTVSFLLSALRVCLLLGERIKYVMYKAIYVHCCFFVRQPYAVYCIKRSVLYLQELPFVATALNNRKYLTSQLSFLEHECNENKNNSVLVFQLRLKWIFVICIIYEVTEDACREIGLI